MALPLSSLPIAMQDAVRSYCTQRLESMRSVRVSWWSHWAALAEVMLPRRYRFFVTTNTYARGQAINNAIVDETGVLAARTLATGLLANLTSPTKPWFRLSLHGQDIPDEGPIADYLAECTRRLLAIFAGTNFYNSLGQAYYDMVVFGSAALIQYEDDQDVFRFYNPELGSFMFGLDKRLTVDTLCREYSYTVAEVVQEFGLENCSKDVQQLFKSGSTKDQEVIIGCAIEPNEDIYANGGTNFGRVVPGDFRYREVYWEQQMPNGNQGNHLLRVAGFREKPFVGLRWDVTSNDPYGRSPGMDALPAIRQLQIEQRRKAEALDKMVRPPMVASPSMKGEPNSILPGGINYVADPSGAGFKPAFTVEPRIAELMEDLREVQSRVQAIFFNDLFRPALDENKVQTATYWTQVQAEQVLLLGPVVERIETEGLNEIIARSFSIANRRGLLPQPPPQIAGAPIAINYISLLAQAQAAQSTFAIERSYQFAGSLAAVIPDIMDNFDPDETLGIYGNLINLDPRVLRSQDQVAAIRSARSQQQQAAAQLQTGATLAQGAQTLSQTDVGGGKNALQAMIGQ